MALRPGKTIFGMQSRFLALFLLADVLTIGALTLVVDRVSVHVLEGQIQERLALSAQNFLDDVDEQMLSILQAVQKLAASPAIVSGVTAPATRPPALLASYEAIAGSGAAVSRIYLLDGFRRVIGDEGRGEPLDFLTITWWESIRRGSFQIETLGSGSAARVLVAYPELGPRGFCGALVVILDLDFVKQITVRQPNFRFSLLTASSRVVLGELPFDVISRIAAADLAPGKPSVIELGDSFHAIFVTRRVPGLDWNLVLSIPREVAMAPVAELRRRMLLVGLASAVLLAFLVFLWVRSLVQRIRHLRDSMDKIIEHDDLTLRVDARSRDELGDLGRVFNRMVEELLRQRASAVNSARMAAVGELGAELAHEINTPLATIVVSSTMLCEIVAKSESPDREIYGRLARRIDATAMRISKIIRGLRSLSREASADDFTDASVNEIVEDTLALCQESLAQRGVRLEVRAPTERVALRCRPAQISQVILNLINNARDAVAELPEKWIRLVVRPVEQLVEISVTDSGAGIDPATQAKIFQPFFTTKEVGKGTGLGLSISQSIVEAHGGRISIDTSSANTRFVIVLPVAQLRSAPDPNQITES